jgi:pimeloyl-ACP methyl ester carboxylesterase
MPGVHLLGHSMGGMAAMFSVPLVPAIKSLVLMSPVFPKQVGAPPVPLPNDLTKLYPLPTFAAAKNMFYQTMDSAEAQIHYARLQPESSQAVSEATNWSISLNLASINRPALCIGAGQDAIVPKQYVQKLSTMLPSAEYAEYNIGHCDVLLKSIEWEAPAARIATFLNAH